ncbi:MerR family transcriptional regulator [Paenibacillus sp. FSL W7-1332]|uniref:MerR family transcriptional regulator n=1 Tax=Paenibacillus sp. FSL W7-1332 TaxID=2921702 RepID=UPI0030D267A7
MFTIGEISKLFQIDIRTLRYYDDIDLFKPATVDHLTNYRYYSVDQFEQLNTILYLKALGIPLKDIKLFLDDREIDNILTLLKEQQRRTEEKIEEYQRIRAKIKSRIEQIEDASNKEELYKIREVEFPERVMVLLKQNIHKSDNLDMPIRLLENSTKMKSTIFLGKVGLSISINRLMQSKFDEYDSIFVIVEQESARSSTEVEEKIWPQGTYITIRFAGTHEDAAPHYRMLLDYIEEKGYSLIEDALEITYIDYGLTGDPSQFVTEIQMLAK